MAVILNQAMTDYAAGVAQDEQSRMELIRVLAPTVVTGAMLINYVKYDDDNMFQVLKTRRGVGGRAKRMEFAGDPVTLELSPNSLEIPLDDIERKRAGAAMEGGAAALNTLVQAKTKTVVVTAYNSHLQEVISAYTDNVTAEAGLGKWLDPNVDPIDEIDGILVDLSRYMTPSHLVMDVGVWRVIKNHPKVRARFIAAGFTLDMVMGQLAVPTIKPVISTVAFNTLGFRNASQTKKGVLAGELFALYNSASPTQYDAAAFKTFSTTDNLFAGVFEYRDEPTRSDVYSLDWDAYVKQTSTKLVKRITVTGAQ